jgi:hypothetical protein
MSRWQEQRRFGNNGNSKRDTVVITKLEKGAGKNKIE